MSDKLKLKTKRLERRKYGIRKLLHGDMDRPRLSVFRSALHIEAQVIDDMTGKTLAAASSKQEGLCLKHGANVAAAKAVGTAIAKKAGEAGIKKVAFDRNGRQYHGRVKALADAARAGGLSF